MFLPPAVARGEAAARRQMATGVPGGDDGDQLDDSAAVDSGLMGAAGAGTGDVWTWDDTMDGDGDSFFGNGGGAAGGGGSGPSGGRGEDFLLTAGKAPQGIPKPPSTMPPAYRGSPMQQRIKPSRRF